MSFYLSEIVTVRDKDWEKIGEHFTIPESIKEVEYQRIKRVKDKERLSV